MQFRRFWIGLALAAAAATAANAQLTIVNSLPGAFIDISGTGTNLGNSCDDCSSTFVATFGNLILPAGTLNASSNGTLCAPTAQNSFGNAALTAASLAGYYPYWDDQRTDLTGGDIFGQNLPDRTIIQWNNLMYFGTAGTDFITYQVQIFGSGPILAQMIYADVTSTDLPGSNGGASATIGAVATGGVFGQWSFNAASVAAGTVLSILPPTSLSVACNPASPASVLPGGNTVLSAAVTLAVPPSPIVSVNVDLTQIGGAASVPMLDNGIPPDAAIDGTYTLGATVAGATTLGVKTLPVTVTDAAAHTASCNITVTVVAPPPPNDNCANAIPIACGSTTAGTNVGATSEAGELSYCASGTATVWYSFVATATAATIDLCGGGTMGDTNLTLFDSPCGGAELACNDDTGGACGLLSTITYSTLTPGNTYLVRVAQFSTSTTGTFTIHLVCGGPLSVACNAASPASVEQGGSTVLSATVTPASPPVAVTSVTVNLTSIGGGAAVAMLDDGVFPDAVANDGTYTVSASVAPATTAGLKSLAVTATDAAASTATCSISLTVTACISVTCNPANPTAVLPGGSSVLSAAVTPCTSLPNGITGVTVNLTSIGGGAAVPMLDDGIPPDGAIDGTYTVSATVSNATTPGVKTLAVTATDVQGRVGTCNISLTVSEPPPCWDETANGGGDAGQTPTTAQVCAGSGALCAITGAVSASADADVYLIQICDHANFRATTVSPSTVMSDTQLFLFNYPSGTGVTSDDDDPAPGTGGLRSTITGVNVSADGLYYLGVSGYDCDPVDAGSLALWTDTVGGSFAVEHAPDGPGAANPWANFDAGASGTGAYRINLTGACLVQLGCPLPGCDSGGIDCDLDNNCEISITDLAILLGHFGQVGPGILGDVDNDGDVDISDLADLLARFGNICH